MSGITIPIDIEFTPRTLAVMEALHKAINPQFQADDAQSPLNLQPDEHYAGVILDEKGQTAHHLVLMAAQPASALNWQDATDWAASVGGSLPSRQEQALLFANCKPHLKPEWHWSSETHKEDASYAWGCYFRHGYQSSTHKSYEGSAVAVRRVSAL